MSQPARATFSLDQVKVDPLLQEVLSPKALGVLKGALGQAELGRRHSDELEAVKEEVFSGDSSVWAVSDGMGFIRALMIDDEALTALSAEELEDTISDVLAEASGRGQATGMAICRRQDEESAALYGQIQAQG